jgi:hypothetical protein
MMKRLYCHGVELTGFFEPGAAGQLVWQHGDNGSGGEQE